MPELRDLHIDIGAERRRRRAPTRADRRRRRDRRRAARATRTAASSRARWTTGSAASSPSRPRGSSPRPAARPATSRRSRSRRRRSRSRGARTTAYSLRPDIAIVVDVTFATDAPGTRREGARPAQVRLRAGDHARLDARPAGLRAAARGRRGGGHPVHRRGLARATPAPTPTRCTSRAAASRPASSRSRCATCTRRSRWSSSTTSRTPRS